MTGVDASADMLAKARAKLPEARFEQGDLTALPLPNGSVDAALCALALVHLPDLAPAFAELARVVRPGGRIVISDVHPFLTALGWQAQFRTAEGGTGFVRLNRHLPSDYVRAATAAGLAVAIPSLIAYRYLRGRVDGLVVLIEKEAMGFIEGLLQEQRTGVIGVPDEAAKPLKRRA